MSKHSSSSPDANAQTTDDISVAKPLVRIVAILYDGMLILAMLFLVGAVLSVLGTLLFGQVGSDMQDAKELPMWYQNFVMTPAFVLTLVGFYGVFWRKSGQTLGMQTWRLKTLDTQGKLLDWKTSFLRIISACLLPALCALIATFVNGARSTVLLATLGGLVFNYLFALFNSRGVGVHDMLSGTLTLKVPKIEHETLWQSIKRRKQTKK